MNISIRMPANSNRSGAPRTQIVADGNRGIVSQWLPSGATVAQIAAATLAVVERYYSQHSSAAVESLPDYLL